MDGFGERQQSLLSLLLKTKQGLTIDDLAEKLEITRNAVRQHVSTLEASGHLERGELLSTGGRPGQVYRLTQKGYNLFPKQYSWFSEVLLEAVYKDKGSDGLKGLLSQLGATVSSSLESRVKDKSPAERVREAVSVMNELAYQADVVAPAKKKELPAIEATNCVYHSLAVKHPEVCAFDLALLAKLTAAKVTHETCIAKGGSVCRFTFDLSVKPRR